MSIIALNVLRWLSPYATRPVLIPVQALQLAWGLNPVVHLVLEVELCVLCFFTNCNLISPWFAFCCCAKHNDQKQSGEGKGLFRLTLYGPSLREAEQKPGVRNWSRGYGGTVTIHLLSTVCSACFLILPGPSTQGWHCPLWTLPFTLIINLENILQTWQ